MKNKYPAVIPRDMITLKKVGRVALYIFGELTTCINEKGECFETNSQICENPCISINTISKSLEELKRAGYIDIKIEKENEVIVNLLRQKDLGQGIGDCKCEWCGTNTLKLQEHHYPIPQSQGGEDTVKICANCHFEFHQGIRIIRILDASLLWEIMEARKCLIY